MRNAWSWAGWQSGSPTEPRWEGRRTAPVSEIILKSWNFPVPEWCSPSVQWPLLRSPQSRIYSWGSPWRSCCRKDSQSQSCGPGSSARWRRSRPPRPQSQYRPNKGNQFDKRLTQWKQPYIKLCLGVGHDLSLLRHPLADEDGPDVGFHQGGVPHVAHPGQDDNHNQLLDCVASPEEQTVGAVPLADDGIPTEHEGGGALLGARHLAEHYPYHARLDHHTHDRLQGVGVGVNMIIKRPVKVLKIIQLLILT